MSTERVVNTERFDAVIVGAGFGGIGAAIQLKRLGYDNFVILDREEDLGGTWHVNHYPGIAVDIPSTTYSYWFEPNPNWSRLFAPGAELMELGEAEALGVLDEHVGRVRNVDADLDDRRRRKDVQVPRRELPHRPL